MGVRFSTGGIASEELSLRPLRRPAGPGLRIANHDDRTVPGRGGGGADRAAGGVEGAGGGAGMVIVPDTRFAEASPAWTAFSPFSALVSVDFAGGRDTPGEAARRG